MRISAYDEIAEWYDEQVRTGTLLHGFVLPALLELIGDVRGQRVCDLACGQGIVARELARRGARVTGVDISERLLALARTEEARDPLGIIYRLDDGQRLDSFEDASLDGVVSNMALMDIPDVGATYRAVARVLRPGGWLAFSITHPCVQMPGSDWLERDDGRIARVSGHYFTEGYWAPENAPGVRGRVGAQHRTLGTYLNGLIEARLRIERLAEPRFDGIAAGSARTAYRDVPGALLVRCLRA